MDLLGVLLLIAAMAIWVGSFLGLVPALAVAGVLVLVFSWAVNRGGGRK